MQAEQYMTYHSQYDGLQIIYTAFGLIKSLVFHLVPGFEDKALRWKIKQEIIV